MDTPALVTVTQRLCPDHSQTLCVLCLSTVNFAEDTGSGGRDMARMRYGTSILCDVKLCHYKEKYLRSCNGFTCFSNTEPFLTFPVRNVRSFRCLPNLQSTSLFFIFEKIIKHSIKSLSLKNLLVDVTHSKRHQ